MALRSLLSSLFTLGKGVLAGLSEDSAGDDPIALFAAWFDDAKRSGYYLPDAMTLVTASPEGTPSGRMMLLKGFDERGFRFFTNYESRKGSELTANPKAAMVFHWNTLQRQVRIEGSVVKLSKEESEEYFRTRARGSQLGAWASKQSSALAERAQLEAQFAEVEERFKGAPVPLPPFWGGFRLVPYRIEFWQGRANRLHDRLRYAREGDAWTLTRLSP